MGCGSCSTGGCRRRTGKIRSSRGRGSWPRRPRWSPGTGRSPGSISMRGRAGCCRGRAARRPPPCWPRWPTRARLACGLRRNQAEASPQPLAAAAVRGRGVPHLVPGRIRRSPGPWWRRTGCRGRRATPSAGLRRSGARESAIRGEQQVATAHGHRVAVDDGPHALAFQDEPQRGLDVPVLGCVLPGGEVLNGGAPDGYQMTWPPSTRRSMPVTNDAALLSRKMTGPTMSSGWAFLPRGVSLAYPSIASRCSGRCVIGV